jgi:hypothetical protein
VGVGEVVGVGVGVDVGFTYSRRGQIPRRSVIPLEASEKTVRDIVHGLPTTLGIWVYSTCCEYQTFSVKLDSWRITHLYSTHRTTCT